jgi:hypothetical protein
MAMRFPVLCIPRDFGVYIVTEKESLGRRNPALFWRVDVYSGMRIIDSDGKAFAVRKYRVNRPSSRFGQTLARIFETSIQVDLQFDLVDVPSLDELKSIVQTAVIEDPEGFEELSGGSVQWWESTLENASSLQEIVNAFAQTSSDARL